jgi:hypothetical protein
MVSAKRIVEIFRTRSGGAELCNPSASLPRDQHAYLKAAAGDEPMVAMVSSVTEWFVLTKTKFVIEGSGKISRIPFADISSVAIPKSDMMNPQIKVEGGTLDVRLRNGSTLRVNVRPGGPYFGVMNVLMYVCRVTASPSGRGLPRRGMAKRRQPAARS